MYHYACYATVYTVYEVIMQFAYLFIILTKLYKLDY